jgi:hypothetical protein
MPGFPHARPFPARCRLFSAAIRPCLNSLPDDSIVNMEARTRRIAVNGLALGAGLLLLAAVTGLMIERSHRPGRSLPKMIIGTKDEIYYSHAATPQDALALGHALQALGYFRGRGSTVLLSRNPGGTILSFVLPDGQWDSLPAISAFEEIGRRIAPAAGGLPLELRLVNSGWHVKKTLQIGKIRVGAKDEIYYLGSATEADARALGRALRDAGYLQDLGVSVSLSRDENTAIGFVVGEGVWRQPGAMAGFERLTRKVAPAVGGLPIQVRLLSPQMEIKEQAELR